jgi:hypothetical protein
LYGIDTITVRKQAGNTGDYEPGKWIAGDSECLLYRRIAGVLFFSEIEILKKEQP